MRGVFKRLLLEMRSTSNTTHDVVPFRPCACASVLPGAAASRRQNVGIWAIRIRWAALSNRHTQRKVVEAAIGVEPMMEVLQTSSSCVGRKRPLCEPT